MSRFPLSRVNHRHLLGAAEMIWLCNRRRLSVLFPGNRGTVGRLASCVISSIFSLLKDFDPIAIAFSQQNGAIRKPKHRTQNHHARLLYSLPIPAFGVCFRRFFSPIYDISMDHAQQYSVGGTSTFWPSDRRLVWASVA